jgi:hypothetical protein
VATDVGLSLDQDDGGAGLARADRSGHAGRARPDDDDVGLSLPRSTDGLCLPTGELCATVRLK